MPPKRKGAGQTASKIDEQVVCPICEETIEDESIQCDGICDSWLHRRCAGLSQQAFERASQSDESFFCSLSPLQQREGNCEPKEYLNMKEEKLTVSHKCVCMYCMYCKNLLLQSLVP